jgi:hypothetical protein
MTLTQLVTGQASTTWSPVNTQYGRAVGRPPLLPPGWIVFALFTLNPVFWLMGVGAFIWSMAAIPLLVWVIMRRGLERPPTVGLFTVYVLWACASGIMLDRFTRFLTFGFRIGVYTTAVCLAYYVYNERRVSRTTFINWVAWMWVWAIIGGYLGLMFPHVRVTTPASILLPRSISGNEFVANLTRPRFAQVQNLFGVPIPRPSTLFAFTNEWGGNVGLLTPFFVAATLYSLDPKRKRLGVIGLAVGVPPMILSVNRGLWLSVGAIFAIVAVRSFLNGRTAPLKMLAAAIVVVAALLAFTPIGTIVGGRLSESDAGSRAGIYQEAWQGALDSPILGWGGPRPSENPFSPSVGTHGHFWFAMFAHGLVGLFLYVSWLVWAMYRVCSRHDPVSIMLASVVFVGALQFFFYNMFPSPLPIILTAIGLLFRADDRVAPDAGPPPAPTLRLISPGTSSGRG